MTERVSARNDQLHTVNLRTIRNHKWFRNVMWLVGDLCAELYEFESVTVVFCPSYGASVTRALMDSRK